MAVGRSVHVKISYLDIGTPEDLVRAVQGSAFS